MLQIARGKHHIPQKTAEILYEHYVCDAINYLSL